MTKKRPTKRTRPWSTVLNEQEHKAASEAAASAGMSKSLWLRQVLRKAAGLGHAGAERLAPWEVARGE